VDNVVRVLLRDREDKWAWARAGCGESLEYGLKIAELHKVIAEKDKYISRLSEQAKAQIQVRTARL